MILKWISSAAVSKLFGDGFAADIAGRGTVYLADEVRKSISRDDEQITRVKLRSGERYTVIARPPATKAERKLAAQQSSLERRYDKLTTPSRKQAKVARRLARAQRKLDKSKPESKKRAARELKEQKLGLEFDRRMRPSRQEIKVAAALTAATSELDASRAASLDKARAKHGLRRRRTRVRVYD
ncbi:hypothetical protein BH10ACT3_BH10ACT3_08760 [soil metagenome]